MEILNLKVNNFGKLSNKEIELKKGINIIYGENESGKSTLLKFIMGMFYGLSKNKNKKFISDYEKYMPWNGGEFSGKITYKLDNNQKYEVFREFKKKNPNIFNENLEDISKEFNIDKNLGNRFFYDQTKVDEELFLSTIVSLQEEVKLDEKEQNILVQKMSNLASTGEDNISFQKIMNNLNKRQMEEIGTARSQDRPINTVMKRMEEIENEKEYLSNFTNKQYEIEEENQELEVQIKEQENKLELLKNLKQVQEKKELQKEKLKINENVKREYNKKIQKLYEKDKEENAKDKLQVIHNKNVIKVGAILDVIFFILTIISIFLIKNDIITAIFTVLTIISVVYTGYQQYKSKMGIHTKEIKQNVEKANTKNEIEVLLQATKKLEEESKNTVQLIEKEYNEEIEKIRNKYIGIIPIKEIDELLSKQALTYEINVMQNKISENKVKLHTINVDKNNILPKLENLAQLEEEYMVLEEQYNELIKNNDIINLVKDEVQNAYEIMRKNVTPKFTSNLSKIIEKISSGKYKNVQLDETNGMIIEIENGNYISAKNLSIGTIDQLYLSLRIGAGMEISEEKLPIILDEAFAYWDQARLENILKYLNEDFKDRQIILFTCTNREKEALQKLGIEFNRVIL